MKKNFIDFMTSEETSGEVEGIFNEFKKLFYAGPQLPCTSKRAGAKRSAFLEMVGKIAIS